MRLWCLLSLLLVLLVIPASVALDPTTRCCLQLRTGEVAPECAHVTLGECASALESWDAAARADLASGPSPSTRFLGSMIVYLVIGLIVFWVVNRFIEPPG